MNKYIFTVVMLLIVLLFGFAIKLNKSYDPVKEEEVELIIEDTLIIEESFEDSVKSVIKELNLAYPDIVYAQAKLETGHFSSDIFNSNNNLFGMKAAKNRPYSYTGVKNGFADYENGWRYSIIDYALYQSSYMRKLSRDQYLNYLQRNYVKGDPNYKKKINKLSKEF